MSATQPSYLVTGATGFLGSHLVAALQRTPAAIWTLGRRHPAGIPEARRLRLTTPDDAGEILHAVTAAAPNVILHLAGAAVASLPDLYRVNAVYGALLLSAAEKAAPDARIVLAGSAAEYGPVEPSALPVTEATLPQPVDPYGITKLAQTLHAMAAQRRGRSVVIARLFNVLGPAMPGHLALGAFSRQIAALPSTGGVLHTGDLSSERDFLPVATVVEMLLALARRRDILGPINVCSGRPTRIRDLVAELVRHCPFPIEVQEDPRRGGVTALRTHFGSAERLQSHGLRPAALDLSQAMREVVEFLRPPASQD